MLAGQNKAGSLWNGSLCPGQAAKGLSAEEM